MKKAVKNGVLCGIIFVLSFACYFLVGARFDLAKSVEATPSVEDVITIAPMAVEDEFSTEEASEEAEEVVVADEEATESVELAMATFTGKMELSIPVNGIALYRQDADDTLRTIRWDEVYDQYTVAQYSANGFVKGNQAAQHYLINRYVSRQVAAYGYDVVNANLVPEEARQLVRNDFANFFIGKITRLSDDGKAVTLNCEPYEGEEVHHAVVNILVGEKATEFWTIFVRDDGVWTLCTEKAHHGYFGNNDAPSQPQQPSEPQQPQQDTDWTFQPVDETPSEEPSIDWGDGWDDTDWTFQPVDETPSEEPSIDWGDGWDDSSSSSDNTDWTFQPVVEEVSQDTGINWGSGWEDSSSSSDNTDWTFQPVVEEVSQDTGINWGSGWEDSSSSSATYVESTATVSYDTGFTFVESPAAAPVVEAAPAYSAPAADTSYTFDSGSESTSGSSDIDWGDGWD